MTCKEGRQPTPRIPACGRPLESGAPQKENVEVLSPGMEKDRMPNPSESNNIAVVRRYFDGCNSGDLPVLLSTLAPDVIHYFLPRQFPPIRGAEHLARHWRKFKQVLDPVWAIDQVIAQGDQVVSEWSCIWTPRDTHRRIVMRGSEWYVMRGGLIAEIRAYLMHDDTSDTELTGFPYAERGYLTLPR
jgi:ketosteroid isomerase-like protein